jgi:hypothetical protein
MVVSYWCFLPVALVLVCSIPCSALAAQGHEATLSAAPGTCHIGILNEKCHRMISYGRAFYGQLRAND